MVVDCLYDRCYPGVGSDRDVGQLRRRQRWGGVVDGVNREFSCGYEAS